MVRRLGSRLGLRYLEMSAKRLLLAAVALAVIAAAAAYGQIDVATSSIQFDLRKLGESI